MKTLLHRGDTGPDHQPIYWAQADADRFALALSASVHVDPVDPRQLVIEAGRLFGPVVIEALVDVDELIIRIEFRPSE